MFKHYSFLLEYAPQALKNSVNKIVQTKPMMNNIKQINNRNPVDPTKMIQAKADMLRARANMKIANTRAKSAALQASAKANASSASATTKANTELNAAKQNASSKESIQTAKNSSMTKQTSSMRVQNNADKFAQEKLAKLTNTATGINGVASQVPQSNNTIVGK